MRVLSCGLLTRATGWRHFTGHKVGLESQLCAVFLFSVSWDGVRLSPLRTSVTIWHIKPALGDGWWRVWSQPVEWSAGGTYTSAALSTTNPTRLDLGSKQAAAVGSRGLTSWAMAETEQLYSNNFAPCRVYSSDLIYIISSRYDWAPSSPGTEWQPGRTISQQSAVSEDEWNANVIELQPVVSESHSCPLILTSDARISRRTHDSKACHIIPKGKETEQNSKSC
jgi:hypothetical protein